MALGCVNCTARMPAFVSTCTRCGGRLVEFDNDDVDNAAPGQPGPLKRFYLSVFGIRRNRLIGMSAALVISIGLMAFTLDKKPELNPVAAEEPVPVSVAQPAIATAAGLDVPLPTRSATPTTRPAPTRTPQSVSPAPIATTPPAVNMPRPEPVPSTTFAVTMLPANCHSEPTTKSGVVARKQTNNVQQVTMFVTMPDGVWHYDGAKKCWLKSDPGPVRLFASKADADAFARSNKPAPTQDPKVKTYLDRLNAMTTEHTAAAEVARQVVAQPSITDPGWRLRYRDAWLAVVPQAADVKALKPVNCHKESHATVSQAAVTLALASEQALRGMETVDAALLAQALASLDDGIRTLNAANDAAKSAFCN